MFLLLTTMNQDGNEREFSCQLGQLELGFDFLKKTQNQGGTLLKANILTQNYSAQDLLKNIPSSSFLTAMRELEKEWQSLPDEPVQLTAFRQVLIDLTQQRLQQCEARMANIELTLDRFRHLLQRANDFYANRSTRSKGFIDHYVAQINQYEVQLIKLRLTHGAALDRLNQLLAT